MARGPRIEYPGAVYHVLCRGGQREPVFRHDACHLLLEIPEGNLVAGMRWLQRTYTRRYNGRHMMGHRSHVSRAARRVGEAWTGIAVQLRDLLQQCKD